MKHKITATFVSLLLALGSVLAAPAPARAEGSAFGCNDSPSVGGWGNVCFFDGTEFGQWYWQVVSIHNIFDEPNHCMQWPSDWINRFSSLVVNPSATGKTSLPGWYVRVWPNNYCTGYPTPTFPMSTESAYNDLRYTQWGNVSNVANSVSLAYIG